jgi:hypothetical protein
VDLLVGDINVVVGRVGAGGNEEWSKPEASN